MNYGVLRYSAGTTDITVGLDQETTIGRSPACDLVIPQPTISRYHARVLSRFNYYWIADMGSVNGTYVNGARISGETMLSDGDQIGIGSPEPILTFSDPNTTHAVGLPAFIPLLIHEPTHAVYTYGQPANLSPLEYRLLRFLAGRAGMVCTREECFQAAWGQPYDHATCQDALNACVAKLRRRLRSATAMLDYPPPEIVVVPRVGFRLDAMVEIVGSDEEPGLLERELGR